MDVLAHFGTAGGLVVDSGGTQQLKFMNPDEPLDKVRPGIEWVQSVYGHAKLKAVVEEDPLVDWLFQYDHDASVGTDTGIEVLIRDQTMPMSPGQVYVEYESVSSWQPPTSSNVESSNVEYSNVEYYNFNNDVVFYRIV